MSGQFSVHFFGKRRVLVSASESGFNVRNCDLPVISTQSSDKRGSRITLNKNEIRFTVYEHFFERFQSFSSNIKKRLIGSHDIQIIVGSDSEKSHHLVKHLPVLRRNTDPNIKLLMLAEFKN